MDQNYIDVKVEKLEKGDGNIFLPIPEEFLTKLGWDEGDLLEIEEIEFSDAPIDNREYGLVLRKL